MTTFTHLNLHSNYSFCRGASTIKSLVNAAKKNGMTHLALTDWNGLYGLGWFLMETKKAGIQPIIGADLQLEPYSCRMLAKNINGYQFLCKVISQIHVNEDADLLEMLLKRPEDVIVFTNDMALLQQLVEHSSILNLYAELIPHKNREEVLAFARRNNLPPVASNDVYMLSHPDWQIHRLLRAIDLNSSLQRIPQHELAHKDAVFCNADEMAHFFPDCPEALSNTLKIARECSFNLDFNNFVFPTFSGPNGEPAFEYLKQQVHAGIVRRYGAMNEDIRKRLDYELSIIEEKGFSAYFLVVADIAGKVKLTCGRGSAAASIVSYALGITHVDPLRHNLFFERFLNRGRKDPPDIDVDFAWDERDTVLKYIFERYGENCAAMVANHSTFKARSAVREIAKVYGIPDAEIGAVTKKMGSYWQPGNLWSLTQSHPIYKNMEFPPPWLDIIAQAEKIRAFPRNLSVHCGGMVIAPNGIDSYVPYQHAKKVLLVSQEMQGGLAGTLTFSNDNRFINVIQWEKDQTEDMKLVKMDILGNRSLAVIRDCLHAVKRNYNIEIAYDKWNPYEDWKTIERFYKGDTMGVFYFESPATRLLLKKVAYKYSLAEYNAMDHYHLNVVVTSIIRPASNQFITDWVERLHGKPWKPVHERLHVLDETLGIMVFQEQLSQAAIHLAGFEPAEADLLRKIISKKEKTQQLVDYYEKFKSGAKRFGVSQEVIDQVWAMIMSFDGYSFCKPHSASYTLVAYKSAYLRAHYPAEFIAAVISNQGGYYSTFGYISEAKRMGIKVLLPDINESEKRYIGNKDWIRVGFMQLKGLSRKMVEKILQERQANGNFTSFQNFIDRVHATPEDTKILIKTGCFDEIEPDRSRPELIWQLTLGQAEKQNRVPKQILLFDSQTPVKTPTPPQYDEETVLKHELEILTFLISRHPLTLYKDRLTKLNYVKACDFDKYVGRKITAIGWFITGKVTSTKKEQLMEFITFEDTTAIYETVFFPNTFEKFIHMISKERPYVLRGLVEAEFGAITLTVEHVAYL